MDVPACAICFETDQLDLYPPGCACRGDTMPVLHIECASRDIFSRLTRGPITHADIMRLWRKCSTCKQDFTGAFALALSEVFVELSRTRLREEPMIYAGALVSYAGELLNSGMYFECEAQLLIAEECGGGGMSVDSQRAICMSKTGRHIEAERLQRDILRRSREMYGESDEITTSHAHNLAASLLALHRDDEAVELLRLVYQTQLDTLGTHASTLNTGALLGTALHRMRAYDAAVEVLCDVHAHNKRIFGASDKTLRVATALGDALFHAQNFAEAERVQRYVVDSLTRPVDGISSSEARLSLALTLSALCRPSDAMALIREQYPRSSSDSDFGEFTTVVGLMRSMALPVGSTVLVRNLVNAVEHNGCTAVVTGFDCQSFRYGLVLPCGKRISVKFECVSAPLN